MNTVDQAIKLVRNWRRHKAVLHPRTAQFLFHWMRGSTVLPYLPLKLHLEPTSVCNLRCPMCPQAIDAVKGDTGYIDLDLFRKIVDESAPFVREINLFFRGEPLLHKSMPELLRYGRSKGARLHVNTNATILRDKQARMLIEDGASKVTISFDGPDKATYETMRKGARYEVTLENVRHFLALVKEYRANGWKVPYTVMQVILPYDPQSPGPSIPEHMKALFAGLPVDELGPHLAPRLGRGDAGERGGQGPALRGELPPLQLALEEPGHLLGRPGGLLLRGLFQRPGDRRRAPAVPEGDLERGAHGAPAPAAGGGALQGGLPLLRVRRPVAEGQHRLARLYPGGARRAPAPPPHREAPQRGARAGRGGAGAGGGRGGPARGGGARRAANGYRPDGTPAGVPSGVPAGARPRLRPGWRARLASSLDRPTLSRILIVSNLFPPDIGGPATYVPRIAAELAARGHRIAVVGGAPPEWRPGAPGDEWPYPVFRVSRALPLPRRLAVAARALARAARGADVLYVQGLAGPEMVAVGVGRLLGKPVALKIVGDNAWEYAIRKGLTDDGIDAFQRQPYGPRLRAVRALVHGYARQVSRLIVPSEYLKGIVRGWGVPPPGCG